MGASGWLDNSGNSFLTLKALLYNCATVQFQCDFDRNECRPDALMAHDTQALVYLIILLHRNEWKSMAEWSGGESTLNLKIWNNREGCL